MRGLRLLWVVVRRSGASKVLVGFLMVYLLCALVEQVVEPSITSYGDALWFLWAVSTTVGLGDITATTLIGRLAAVLCSIYAIVTTAIITGVVVDYYNEVRQYQFNQSLADFLDKLEHLPELDKEELARLSAQVRKRRQERG